MRLGRLLGALGASWGPLGGSWGLLWVPLGGLLGVSWEVLEASMVPRGPQEAPEGTQQAPRGAQEVPKRRPRASKRRPRATQEAPKKPPRAWKSRKNRFRNALLFRTSFRNDFLANFHRFLVYFGIQKTCLLGEISGRHRIMRFLKKHAGACTGARK